MEATTQDTRTIREESRNDREPTAEVRGQTHQAAERARLLVDWNQTAADYPRDRCLHQLIEAQVVRTPGALAVECASERLSYAALNAQANRLARHLQSIGVGPEILVGVCLESSAPLLVALLAVMKAGGAYVPLDPAYPKERLRFMISDSAMKVLITDERLGPALPQTAAQIVLIEQSAATVVDDRENPVSSVNPENLAYVIYTSGSTGTPKGVMVPHRALVNYLSWAVKAYRVEQGSGAPVHSSISFDLTITGLFTPLLIGRTVFILPAEQNVDRLGKLLKTKAKFSLVKITPAHLELLCAQLHAEEADASTNAFIIGGEALFGASLGPWRRCAPEATLVNEYGPTETAVGCCAFFVPKDECFEGRIPIGKPIANTQLYVLDQHLEPVPIGVPGELYIAGDGLARGYLNQPELTKSSFVRNPFSTTAGAKMYKSGDLVRYREDGNLEFLGRVDDQIKIRSYRIEPAEVEAALLSHPQLQAAVVAARSDGAGDRYLTAYVVPKEIGAPSPADLREHLRTRLPAYMIPVRFTMLRDLPLTANGKFDRAALPEHEAESASISSGRLASDERGIEERLTALWENTLQQPVRSNENFFDLGGDSLMAVRLAKEVSRSFKTHVDALTVYQHPTPAQFSAALALGQARGRVAKLVQVREGDGGGCVFFLNAPLDFARLGSRSNGKEAFYISEVPFAEHVIAAALRFDSAAYPKFEELVAPHTRLILESGLPGPYFLAGFSSYGRVAFEAAHQLLRAGKAVDGVFLFDSDMRPSRLSALKVVCRRHWLGTVAEGPSYLVKKAKHRFAYEKEKRQEIAAARLAGSAEESLPDGEVSWLVLERIWNHAIQSYRPTRIDTHGVLFRAEVSIYGDIHDHDGCLGWRGFFQRGLTVLKTPGDHMSMWKEPDVVALSNSWEGCLRKLRRGAPKVLCSAPTLLVALACSV